MIFTVDGTPLQGFCRDIFPGHILTLASGITGGFGGDRRVEYIIPHKAREEGYHEFVIESSCNGMFGVPWNGDTIQPPDVYPPPTLHSKAWELNFIQMNRYFTLASADLVVPNQEAWNLLWDFEALQQLVDTLPGNTPYVSLYWNFKCSSAIRLQNKALVTANEIMNIFKRGDATAVFACRKKAQEVFGKDWDTKGAGIYEEGPEKSNIWGIGQ